MRPVLFRSDESRSAPPEGRIADAFAGFEIVAGSLPLALEAEADRPLVVFHDRAWLEILHGAHGDATREQVGVCYGHALREDRRDVVIVTRAYRARNTNGSRVHVTLDARAWDDIHAQRGRGAPGEAVVGWWHTHPDLGAFFSGVDQRTQSQAFPRSWHFGLVLDPVRDEALLFRGGDGQPTGLAPLIIARSRPAAPEFPYSALLLALSGVPEDGRGGDDAGRTPPGEPDPSRSSEAPTEASTARTAHAAPDAVINPAPRTPMARGARAAPWPRRATSEARGTRPTPYRASPGMQGADDLSRASWLALAAVRAGATLVATSSPSGGPSLIFDRPALKRRYPEARELLGAGRARYPLSLPLDLADVVAVLWHGALLAPAAVFFRSRP